jgi:hypothetical protein
LAGRCLRLSRRLRRWRGRGGDGGRPSPRGHLLAGHEDHDFAEINHVSFPARRELRKLTYWAAQPRHGAAGGRHGAGRADRSAGRAGAGAAGRVGCDGGAGRGLPAGPHLRPGFCGVLFQAFAAQGLLVLDASGREFHRMGAPVLRAAWSAPMSCTRRWWSERRTGSRGLSRAGGRWTAIQPAVSHRRRYGARLALKRLLRRARRSRMACGTAGGGRQSFSTADLVGILEAEPERISPSALLRPVFQDFLLSTSLSHRRRAGGDCLLCPIRRALRAHSGPGDAGAAALFRHADRAGHRRTARKHGLTLERVFAGRKAASLASCWPSGPCPSKETEAGGGGDGAGGRACAAGGVDGRARCGAGPVGGDRGQQDALPDEPLAHPGGELPVAARGLAGRATPRPSARRSIPAACSRSGCMARLTTLRATALSWRRS